MHHAFDPGRAGADTSRMRRPAFIALPLLLFACGAPLHDYPTDVVDNFLGACRSKGGSDRACQCSLDALRGHFTAEEYAALEKKVIAEDREATKALADVAADCVGL